VVQIRLTRADELAEVLALLLTQPGIPPAEVRAQVQAFIKYTQDRPMPPESQYVAVEGDAIVAAAVALDSPGRTALVFFPSVRVYPHRRDVVVDLLDRLVAAGRRRGLRLFQVLLGPEATEDEDLLASAGFERLAELIYLERASTLPLDAEPDPPDLRWTCYDRTTHSLFRQVIQATYQNSLDCPALTGRRDMEDILAGHKDVGEFDPQRWFILSQHDRPVGCLLLSRVRHRSALELVYMGLCPEARGKGLGRSLLRRAIQVTLGSRLAYVTLAVDAANTPAHSLYRRCGFTETMRRSAWILMD